MLVNVKLSCDRLEKKMYAIIAKLDEQHCTFPHKDLDETCASDDELIFLYATYESLLELEQKLGKKKALGNSLVI